MSQPHNVSPNITDPDLLPSRKPASIKPSVAPAMSAMRDMPTMRENPMHMPANPTPGVVDNSFNRNFVIILVVLAVILILFLAYMYFYKGSEVPVAKEVPNRQVIYGLPPGTTYPLGVNPMQEVNVPPTTHTYKRREFTSGGREETKETPKPDSSMTHDKLKREINSSDLRKELEEMNNKKTHDNYPSEYNLQPTGVRFDCTPTNDDDDDNDDNEDNTTDLIDNTENIEESRGDESVTVSDSDVHSDISRFICGAKLKSCGFCKRKVSPGEKCTQHK